MKDPKTLTFKEVTPFDLTLIKGRAVDLFINSACPDAQTAMISIVFDMIHAKGFDIVKSDREPTWSSLKSSHYIEGPVHNNWWKEPKHGSND